jgi:hemerythrin-like domain-containing protein
MGVLDRVLLIYDEILWPWLLQELEFPPEVLGRAADIVRRFIEDYHEQLEEDFIFPRFERAAKLTSLVGVLRVQHQAGRRLTDAIRARATRAAIKDPAERMRLRESLRLFVRMCRPHAAREDTVLLPAVRSIVSRHEFGALGEEFERKEHQLFGSDGYEGVVAEVASLEAALGIEELAQFTPEVRA